jgi:putative SOS response-associated peptidase YedK
MCGRYAIYGPVSLSREAKEAANSLELDLERDLNQRDPQYNVAPTQSAPVIAHSENGYVVNAIRWGLVPSWAKDVAIGSRMINARAETVSEKPAFRSAFKKRRCLVPASGYYEWTGAAGSKQPYWIHAPDDQLLIFAGLWDIWRAGDTAEWLRTYTIITGAPGKVSGDIHDRQPVILPPDCWDDWLQGDPSIAQATLTHAIGAEAELTYHPVSKAVGNPRNQGPELVEPISL